MYLLVFVMLVIGLIGLYGQILSLQAARITAGMTGLANSMITWHTAAVSMGAKVAQTAGITVPCSLTYSLPSVAASQLASGSVGKCNAPTGSGDSFGTVTQTSAGGGLNTLGTNGGASNGPVHLPADYNFNNQFYSILYQAANGQYYVITFVPPPVISVSNPAPGFISLPPNNNLLSFSLTDLQHQLSLTSLPDYSYGEIKTAGLTSTLESRALERGSVCANGVCFQYAPPFDNSGNPMMLNGTIAIISSTASF